MGGRGGGSEIGGAPPAASLSPSSALFFDFVGLRFDALPSLPFDAEGGGAGRSAKKMVGRFDVVALITLKIERESRCVCKLLAVL